MTYKDCIKVASLYLDDNKLYEYINDVSDFIDEETKRKIRYLCSCVDVVANEIACEYFPIQRTEKALAKNKRIEYADMGECVVEIRYVKRDGQKVNYNLYTTYIGVDEDGWYEVCYYYSPKSFSGNLEENIDLYGRITPRIVGIGAVAEYCLAFDRFDEAISYDKTFKDALIAVETRRQARRVKGRRWA